MTANYNTYEFDAEEEQQKDCLGLKTAFEHIKEGVKSFRKMTASQILGMVLGVCFVIVGNAGQLLAVNEWLSGRFTNGGTPWITALTVTATSTTAFFTLCFAVWCLIVRPNIRFLFRRDAIILAFMIGFGNASNGVLIISATPNTPEILQAFLFSTTIFWTFVFMKVVSRDTRTYANPLVMLSFLFSLGGIVAGSASQFSNQNMTTNNKEWTAVFACGMIMVAIYNVFVFLFMNKYAPKVGAVVSSGMIKSLSRHSLDEDALLAYEVRKQELNAAEVSHEQPPLSDFQASMTLKLGMLFVTGITQTIFMWSYVMTDALPWFGTSSSVGEAWTNVGLGWKCVFLDGCHNDNALYAFLFCFFYVFNYFGTAYLNAYSAAVTSMITQLSSPIAALTLLIFPAWNVSQQPVNVPESIIAIILLVVGALLYTAWEESTRAAEEKAKIRSIRSKRSVVSHEGV